MGAMFAVMRASRRRAKPTPPSGPPYRTAAEVPYMPTPQELQAIVKQESKRRKVVACLLLTALPSGGLLTIGAAWPYISGAIAATSIIALIIATIGAIVATSISFE